MTIIKPPFLYCRLCEMAARAVTGACVQAQRLVSTTIREFCRSFAADCTNGQMPYNSPLRLETAGKRLSRTLRCDQKDGGGQAGAAVAKSGREGCLDLAADGLSGRLVRLLLVDQPAGGTHDAGVLGLLVRGRGDDVGRLAVNLDRRESGGAEKGAYIIGVGERHRTESARRLWRRRSEMAQHHLVRNEPVAIVFEPCPTGEAQPSAGPQRAQQIGERCRRVGKKHDAKARCDEIEMPGCEFMGLRVGLDE